MLSFRRLNHNSYKLGSIVSAIFRSESHVGSAFPSQGCRWMHASPVMLARNLALTEKDARMKRREANPSNFDDDEEAELDATTRIVKHKEFNRLHLENKRDREVKYLRNKDALSESNLLIDDESSKVRGRSPKNMYMNAKIPMDLSNNEDDSQRDEDEDDEDDFGNPKYQTNKGRRGGSKESKKIFDVDTNKEEEISYVDEAEKKDKRQQRKERNTAQKLNFDYVKGSKHSSDKGKKGNTFERNDGKNKKGHKNKNRQYENVYNDFKPDPHTPRVMSDPARTAMEREAQNQKMDLKSIDFEKDSISINNKNVSNVSSSKVIMGSPNDDKINRRVIREELVKTTADINRDVQLVLRGEDEVLEEKSKETGVIIPTKSGLTQLAFYRPPLDINSNTCLNELQYCSQFRINRIFPGMKRKDVDNMLEKELITVNNVLANKGTVVRIGDIVRVKNEIMNWVDPSLKDSKFSVEASRHRYIKVFKPRGVSSQIRTERASDNVATITGCMQHLFRGQFYPIGTLSIGYSGVLLVTNDSDLVNAFNTKNLSIKNSYAITVLTQPVKNTTTEDAEDADDEEGVGNGNEDSNDVKDNKTEFDANKENEKKFVVGIRNKTLSELKAAFIANGFKDASLMRNQVTYNEISRKVESVVHLYLTETGNQLPAIKKVFESEKIKLKHIERLTYAGISLDGLDEGSWKFLNDSETAIVDKYLRQRKFKIKQDRTGQSNSYKGIAT